LRKKTRPSSFVIEQQVVAPGRILENSHPPARPSSPHLSAAACNVAAHTGSSSSSKPTTLAPACGIFARMHVVVLGSRAATFACTLSPPVSNRA
jgi:hypothetical protein